MVACAAGAASVQAIAQTMPQNPPQNPPQTADWVQSCLAHQLCFDHPADWRLQPGQGVDSSFQVFRSAGWTLSLDYGRYPLEVPGWQPLREASLQVDGRPARRLSETRREVLQVPRVRDSALGPLQLTMVLQAEPGQGQGQAEALARRLFSSIRFLPQR